MSSNSNRHPPASLSFTRVADECCDLCNPVHLADFETVCVAVRPAGTRCGALVVCAECIRSMGGAVDNGSAQRAVDGTVAAMSNRWER